MQRLAEGTPRQKARVRRRPLRNAIALGGVVGLLAWLLLEHGVPRPPAVPMAAALATTLENRETLVAPLSRDGEASAMHVEVEVVAAAPLAAEQVAPQPSLAEVRGRLLLPGGKPAAGASIKVRGWPGNQELVLKHGVPENWENPPEAFTDASGCFRVSFDAPLAFQFVLDANMAGYVEVSWRWGSLPPGEVTNVGTIRLTVPGSIRGRLVGAEGAPVPGEWMVYAETSHAPPGAGADETRVMAPANATSGEFLLEGVPPGTTKLRASRGSRTGSTARRCRCTWVRSPRPTSSIEDRTIRVASW